MYALLILFESLFPDMYGCTHVIDIKIISDIQGKLPSKRISKEYFLTKNNIIKDKLLQSPCDIGDIANITPISTCLL